MNITGNVYRPKHKIIMHQHFYFYRSKCVHRHTFPFLPAGTYSPHSSVGPPPSLHPSHSPCIMAILSNTIPVYVAFLFILKYVSKTAGSGLSSESSSRLLPPYDELYYRGVRAYFREDWERAAEFLEKSISTRDMLLRTRRKCHDECLTIGDEKFSKLGNC